MGCHRCFDWGTIGWVLQTERADMHKYKWFMFLNSSTRGPFLPAYWPVRGVSQTALDRQLPLYGLAQLLHVSTVTMHAI